MSIERYVCIEIFRWNMQKCHVILSINMHTYVIFSMEMETYFTCYCKGLTTIHCFSCPLLERYNNIHLDFSVLVTQICFYCLHCWVFACRVMFVQLLCKRSINESSSRHLQRHLWCSFEIFVTINRTSFNWCMTYIKPFPILVQV